MVECVTRVLQRTSAQAWRCAINHGKNCLLKPSSFALYQKRSIYVPPLGVCTGLMGVATYFMTKLVQPDPRAVSSIFGPPQGSYEERFSGNKIRCIARKGAGNDVPENTMTAFKYCIDNGCKFIELDVRCCKDGELVLLHDRGLNRLSDICLPDIRQVNFEAIQNFNVAAKHPNRQKYRKENLCLFNDAVDFLLDNKAKILIDIKENDPLVLDKILNVYAMKPGLYKYAAITSANPWIIYKIRSVDPEIVAALKYEPYSVDAETDEDGKTGPTNLRYGLNTAIRSIIRGVDVTQAVVWRRAVRWCGIGAVLLHKDIASQCEIQYWRDLDIRCIGVGVDTPMEKLYWRKVLKSPYLTNTLVGETDLDDLESLSTENERRPENIVDILLDDQREPREALRVR